MVGHLDVPGLTDGLPSSLTPAVYALLRADYGFDGVVFTDDLGAMKAVTGSFELPEAVERALAAGADVALWSTGGRVAQVLDRLDRRPARRPPGPGGQRPRRRPHPPRPSRLLLTAPPAGALRPPPAGGVVHPRGRSHGWPLSARGGGGGGRRWAVEFVRSGQVQSATASPGRGGGRSRPLRSNTTSPGPGRVAAARRRRDPAVDSPTVFSSGRAESVCRPAAAGTAGTAAADGQPAAARYSLRVRQPGCGRTRPIGAGPPGSPAAGGAGQLRREHGRASGAAQVRPAAHRGVGHHHGLLERHGPGQVHHRSGQAGHRQPGHPADLRRGQRRGVPVHPGLDAAAGAARAGHVDPLHTGAPDR